MLRKEDILRPSVSTQPPLPSTIETTRIQSGSQNARDRSHPADNSDKFTDDVKGKASQDETRQKAKEGQGALQCDNTWFCASIRATQYF